LAINRYITITYAVNRRRVERNGEKGATSKVTKRRRGRTEWNEKGDPEPLAREEVLYLYIFCRGF